MQDGQDAHLRVQLIWRHHGAADVVLATVEGYGNGDMGNGNIGIDEDVNGIAAASSCGDQLVMKITFLDSASNSDYMFLDAVLRTPVY